jgi:MFS family permease
MSGMQMMTAATIGGAVVYGMAVALFGRLKLALAGRLQQDDGHVRRMLLALNVALIPLVVLSGVLLDVFGARPVLMGGSVLLSVALVGLGLRPTYPQAFVSLLLAVFAAAAVGTAATVLMPRAFFAPATETAASLNLGYVFIALGALLAPVLADVLLDMLGPRRTLPVFALLALTPAFLAVFAPAEAWQLPDHAGDAVTLLTEPSSWLAALVFFFYAPLEASISLWTFTLLAERDQDERQAGRQLIGFWAALLASRLLVALLQHADYLTEWWDRWLVIVPPLVAATLLGNLAGASQRGRPTLGLIVLGLLLGPVFPTLLAMIFRHVAPSEQGLTYGVVFAAGSLGSLLLSPLIVLRTRPPLQTALRVPIFLALLLTAAALVMGLMTP